MFSPDVVWTLVPAVLAALKNAVFALLPFKKLRLPHKDFTPTTIQQDSLLVYASVTYVKAKIGSF
jgi:hypothetical protein